jgi:ATP-dependent DNA helicase RecG
MQVRYEFGEKPKKTEPLSAMQRTEIWDYPLKALREAVINALIHQDYFQTGFGIQIRFYDDCVVSTNPGGLPEGMTVDELRREGHHSLPRNTLLAQVFYFVELLEKWGTGTSRGITLCQNHGIPEPEFSAHPDWFSVTFAKDFYTIEKLRALGLSDRQIQAVRYVREQATITNKEYRELTGMSPRAALRELTDLCTREILVKQGTTGKKYRIPS